MPAGMQFRQRFNIVPAARYHRYYCLPVNVRVAEFQRLLACTPVVCCYTVPPSVADPHHLDADPDHAIPFDVVPDSLFHSDADPDPTFHFDIDPDPAFDLDPGPDPAFQCDRVRIKLFTLIRIRVES